MNIGDVSFSKLLSYDIVMKELYVRGEDGNTDCGFFYKQGKFDNGAPQTGILKYD